MSHDEKLQLLKLATAAVRTEMLTVLGDLIAEQGPALTETAVAAWMNENIDRVSGPPGSRGDTGTRGLPGPAGRIGERGPVGPKGSKGGRGQIGECRCR